MGVHRLAKLTGLGRTIYTVYMIDTIFGTLNEALEPWLLRNPSEFSVLLNDIDCKRKSAFYEDSMGGRHSTLGTMRRHVEVVAIRRSASP